MAIQGRGWRKHQMVCPPSPAVAEAISQPRMPAALALKLTSSTPEAAKQKYDQRCSTTAAASAFGTPYRLDPATQPTMNASDTLSPIKSPRICASSNHLRADCQEFFWPE